MNDNLLPTMEAALIDIFVQPICHQIQIYTNLNRLSALFFTFYRFFVHLLADRIDMIYIYLDNENRRRWRLFDVIDFRWKKWYQRFGSLKFHQRYTRWCSRKTRIDSIIRIVIAVASMILVTVLTGVIIGATIDFLFVALGRTRSVSRFLLTNRNIAWCGKRSLYSDVRYLTQ